MATLPFSPFKVARRFIGNLGDFSEHLHQGCHDFSRLPLL
jgi:hypothetical protein